MEILIVEKDHQHAEWLCELLHEYNPGNQMIQYADNKDLLYKILLQLPRFEIIFLDINIVDEHILSLINSYSKVSAIIFLTNQQFNPIQPISTHYFDYLIKPLTALGLGKALLKYERFKFQLLGTTENGHIKLFPFKQFNYKKRFLIHLGSRMFFVNANDIAYFIVSEKNVYLVNIEGTKYPLDYSLEKLQQLVDPLKFFRVNRKILCSTNAISEIKTYMNSRLKIVLAAGNHLAETVVSREKVAAFKIWVEG